MNVPAGQIAQHHIGTFFLLLCKIVFSRSGPRYHAIQIPEHFYIGDEPAPLERFRYKMHLFPLVRRIIRRLLFLIQYFDDPVPLLFRIEILPFFGCLSLPGRIRLLIRSVYDIVRICGLILLFHVAVPFIILTYNIIQFIVLVVPDIRHFVFLPVCGCFFVFRK